MTKFRNLLTRVFAFLLLANIVASCTFTYAQRKSAAVAETKSSAPKCSGAWTGTVTYTRAQSQTDQKKVERVSGRGYDSRNWEMKYEYNARVVVAEAPEQDTPHTRGPVANRPQPTIQLQPCPNAGDDLLRARRRNIEQRTAF